MGIGQSGFAAKRGRSAPSPLQKRGDAWSPPAGQKDPRVSSEIDAGRPLLSFATRANRVSSPSGEYGSAGLPLEAGEAMVFVRHGFRCFHLLSPATVVSEEGLARRSLPESYQARLSDGRARVPFAVFRRRN